MPEQPLLIRADPNQRTLTKPAPQHLLADKVSNPPELRDSPGLLRLVALTRLLLGATGTGVSELVSPPVASLDI